MGCAGFHRIALNAVLWCVAAADVLCSPLPRQVEERAVAFPAGSASLSPRTQAALQALAQEIGEEAQVTVIGRDDDGSPQGLAEARAKMLSAALRAAGIARSNITVSYEPVPGVASAQSPMPSHIRWAKPGQAERAPAVPVTASPEASAPAAPQASLARPEPARVAAPPPASRVRSANRFDILSSDGDVATTLRRWGGEHGYQVVWDAPMSAPVTGELTLDAKSLPEAVGQVLFGLQKAGYPVQAHQYPNNLIRITAVGQ